MPQSGFLEQKPRSPGSLAIVIAVHGAAIAALMLAKQEFIQAPPVVTKAYQVPLPKDPPPEPLKKVEPRQVQSRIDTVPPIVPRPVLENIQITEPQPLRPITFDPGPVGPAVTPRVDPPEPVREPVRVAARIDPRSELQPPYPASEERAEVEGSVTISVLIGTDGRVKAVEKVRATSEAFFRATERQALRHWRFKPATADGRPVETRTTMTVHFQLRA
jgi:protein TonB